jgi:trk system potassium uptake protein TrkH
MNFRLVLHLTGKTLMVEAVCLLPPMLVAALYREDPRPFIYSVVILVVISLALSLIRCDDRFFAREGLFSAGLIWILMSALGALPFWFSGRFLSFVDCLFECVSGFTTTGASVLTQVESLPRSILFWRSFTHWLGGMGILVLTIALLPSLGSRTLHVMRAESPGPLVNKLVPKTSQFSRLLCLVYLVLTVLEIVCLLLCGLPLFDSVAHSFSTAGTGGFSVRNLSVGAYGNTGVETVIGTFTLFFSVNLSLYLLLLLGKVRQVLRSDELRFFLGAVLISTACVTLNIRPLYASLREALHHAFFQVATIISTTGFSTVNFDQWPEFSRILLVLLMLCGACAGSTGGAIKCSRILVTFRVIAREIHLAIHPHSVCVIKLDGQTLKESTIRSILAFIAAYFLMIFGATLILSLDNYTFGTTLTAVIACIGNIGPGLELVGPVGSYSFFSVPSKLVLSLCMIIGRLEMMPVLVLFDRAAWKRF